MMNIKDLLTQSFKKAVNGIAGATVAASMMVSAVDANKAEAASIATDTVQATWSGAIETVDPELLDGNIEVGDPWTISLDIDLTAPDDTPADPNFSFFTTAVTGGTMDIGNGDVVYNFDGGLVQYSNGTFSIGFLNVHVTSSTGLGGDNILGSGAITYNSSGASTDTIKDSLENIMDGNGVSSTFEMMAFPGGPALDLGLAIPTIIEIPEPGTVVLLGAGLACLAAMRRRKEDTHSLEI